MDLKNYLLQNIYVLLIIYCISCCNPSMAQNHVTNSGSEIRDSCAHLPVYLKGLQKNTLIN